MTVMEAVQQRYSVRKYKSEAVEPEKLDRVMEAARLAPSAGNRQDWRFVVVQDADRRRRLAEAAGQAFVGQAPVVIVACSHDPHAIMPCGHYTYVIDCAIALEHIALQAAAEGLGTCWIGAFSQDAVREAIGAPPEVQIVELMPLGYPDIDPHPKTRLPLSEIVMADVWRGE